MGCNIWRDCKRVPITELLSFIVDNRGKTVPTAPSGHKLIATNCVTNDTLFPVYEKIRYLSEETYQTWFRAHPLPGDILFVNKGTPGRVCLVPDPVDFCIAQDMIALRADDTKIYNKYLFAVLRSREIQQQIYNTNVGDVIPHFKKQFMSQLLIPVPEREIQEAIGDLYYLLSFKIEHNKKINENLEKQAQALFKHWFVDFEFPNEEGKPYRSSGGKMVESEMGLIPEGWEIKSLQELCDKIESGGTPNRKHNEYWENGTINWFKTGELVDKPLFEAKEKITHLGLINSNCKLWNPKTILIAIYASPTVGKLGILENIAASNQACSGIVVKESYGYLFIYHTLYYFRNYLQNLASGSAQQNLNVSIIKNLDIITPPATLAKMYHDVVERMYNIIVKNERENITISSIRDTLLPKLMNGTIDIK